MQIAFGIVDSIKGKGVAKLEPYIGTLTAKYRTKKSTYDEKTKEF